MAIDTRSKRASVVGLAIAARLTLPLSDGTVGQPDRQHVSFSYAGIASIVLTGRITFSGEALTFGVLTAEGMTIGAASGEALTIAQAHSETVQ